MNFSQIEQVEKLLKQKTFQSKDVTFYSFNISNELPAKLIFIDNMADKEMLNDFVSRSLIRYNKVLPTEKLTADFVMQNILTFVDIKKIETLNDCITEVFSGNAILIVQGVEQAISIGAKGYSLRGISESPTSTVIKGPREAFIEDAKMNTIMLRRKLRSPNLICQNLLVGKQSQTLIYVCFLKGIAKPNLVKTILKKIKNINIDAILDSTYIARFLEEKHYSIFKQVGSTEKPDILASKLLEGRIGIIVDGSPLCLTVPFILIEDFISSQDYYEKSQIATFYRIIRLIAVTFAILLPALYVAGKEFHPEIFPLKFLLKVFSFSKQLSLSTTLEMFVVLLFFEILKEASLRMPKYVGSALSVASAIILGDIAIRSGILSISTILVVAISGLALFTVPDSENTFSLIRFAFLILAGVLGVFGIIVGTVFLLIYLNSLENFGSPYLAPYAPLLFSDLKDGLVKETIFSMKKRPNSIIHNNDTRMKIENDD